MRRKQRQRPGRDKRNAPRKVNKAGAAPSRRAESFGGRACALLNQGIEHLRAGRFAEAERVFQYVLASEPENDEAFGVLGLLAHQTGNDEAAVELIGRAVAIDGSKADYHANLGSALGALGRLDEAVASCRRGVAIDPDYADARYNLALFLQRQEKTEEAVEQYRKLLAIEPGNDDALDNLGVALSRLGRLDEAIKQYRRALAIAPDNPSTHQNLAHALLMRGDYAEGWAEYEWRWSNPDFPSARRDFAEPQWDGAPLDGRVILLHAEQGMGDTIQFVRFAPLVAARGGRVVLECQEPLAPLLAGCDGVEHVVAKGEPLPRLDVHAPLLSLPHLLGVTLDTLPAEIPYLAVPAGRMVPLTVPPTTAIKAGLLWAGCATDGDDHSRSCPPDALAPLLDVAGVSLFSLQKGPQAAELERLDGPGRIADLGYRLADFADTAAAIAQLDVVIGVDSAAAHLAGALGRRVWLLLHTPSDWRWMSGRDDSPWYPSARLFRQPRDGDWAGAVVALRAELERLAGNAPKT
ncbi:MAG: tetratricopeptide repeat protein [Alphaproteobacteria bacterium]